MQDNVLRTARDAIERNVIRNARSVRSNLTRGAFPQPPVAGRIAPPPDRAPVEVGLSPPHFASLLEEAEDYLRGRDLYVQDGNGTTHPAYRMPLRVVTDSAHLACAVLPVHGKAAAPEFTIFATPGLAPTRPRIAADLDRRAAVISGESAWNLLCHAAFLGASRAVGERDALMLPNASAHAGHDGEVALVYGLSGEIAGLAADSDCQLLAARGAGWAPEGVFRLSLESGPDLPVLWPEPRHVVLLCSDWKGVLPRIALLTPKQAILHLVNGYSHGRFHSCFSEDELPLPPASYARLLARRLRAQNPHCWLVNTGWVGGPAGDGEKVLGSRLAMLLSAALNGSLCRVSYNIDPIFQWLVPAACPGLPDQLLDARAAWSSPSDYDAAARRLAGAMERNYQRFCPDPALA